MEDFTDDAVTKQVDISYDDRITKKIKSLPPSNRDNDSSRKIEYEIESIRSRAPSMYTQFSSVCESEDTVEEVTLNDSKSSPKSRIRVKVIVVLLLLLSGIVCTTVIVSFREKTSSIDIETCINNTVIEQDYRYTELVDDMSKRSSFDATTLSARNSNQREAMCWLVTNQLGEKYSIKRLLQRYALAVFYHSLLRNSNDSTFENWLEDSSECEWSNIKCTEGIVTSLKSADGNLVGTLPTEIGFLSELDLFDVANNPLISGSIPSTIFSLIDLKFLYLRNNTFTGELGTSLEDISNLVRLEEIDMSLNHFNGTIPVNILTLPKIRSIALAYNKLTGKIPAEVGQAKNLEHFFVQGNELSGKIPTQMGMLKQLKYSSFKNNSKLEPFYDAKICNIGYICVDTLNCSKTVNGVCHSCDSENIFCCTELNESNDQTCDNCKKNGRCIDKCREMCDDS